MTFSYFPGLKLSRFPRSFTATLAALPSVSPVPLASFLIRFLRALCAPASASRMFPGHKLPLSGMIVACVVKIR